MTNPNHSDNHITMNNSKSPRVLLTVSGLLATSIGGAVLLAPASFHAISGIELGEDVNLISEIRAPGGALLIAGLLMWLGVFVRTFAFTSTVIAAAVFMSYGLSRLLSMAVDGLPDSGLVAATAIELTIGAISLRALGRYRRTGTF